ncbi:hypothetical protein V6N12_002479 [Hibiscus sabdariffa]|uniref:TMV resistance protein N-like n=1 Tax=Hibiscus sabdariffa TaxID=183260 RepID=A0ABR2B4L9_9ROSI
MTKSFFSSQGNPKWKDEFHGSDATSTSLLISSLLRELNLRDCNLLHITSQISCMFSLEDLDLSGNSFITIPSSLARLSKLQSLSLEDCRELKSLPELPTNIESVNIDGCASLELVANPSKVCNSVDWADIRCIHCYRLAENINASTLLKRHLKVFANSRKLFELVIPGSKIPDWFSHQRVGFSIKLPLPLDVNGWELLSAVFFSFMMLPEMRLSNTIDIPEKLFDKSIGAEKVGEAFAKHEERYKEDKILKWRNALTQVANIKGWHLNNRHESEFIGDIVKKVSAKLCQTYPVVHDKLASDVIEAMIIDNKREPNKRLNLSVDAFSKMKKLRLLKVLCLSNCDGLTYLSNELRLLDWKGCPLRSLPSSFQPDNLVALLLQYSHIKQLWKGTRPLHKLKVLNLKGSGDLIRTPDFRMTPDLEILILEGCTKIVDVHPSIGELNRLKTLNLRGCKSLRNLPTKIGMESLQTFILSGCSNLLWFPEIDCKMECLKTLDLSGCYSVGILPESLQQAEFLEELDLSGTVITKPPCFIFRLKNLKVLSFNGCKGSSSKFRQNLPSLFKKIVGGKTNSMALMLPSLSGLSSLTELKLRDCNLCEGDIPNDISCLSSLKRLDLSSNNFISIPDSLNRLSKLENLELMNCRGLKSLPELPTSTNCYRLAENNNALTLLKKHLKAFGNSRKRFDVIIPGNEIPGWFSHQRVDSSIKIPLPLNIQNDGQWMGVAFCCIFANGDASGDEDIDCKVVIRCREPRHLYDGGLLLGKEYNQPIKDNHLFLRYLPRVRLYPCSLENECGESETENISTPDCSNQECDELELSFTYNAHGKCAKVKKCGVRIVYEKDLLDVQLITTLQPKLGSWDLVESFLRWTVLKDNLAREWEVLSTADAFFYHGTTYLSVDAFFEDEEIEIAKVLCCSNCDDLNCLPNELRLLVWIGSPCKLRVINFKGSRDLIKTPNFATSMNLDVLILEGCTRLVHVHQFVSVLWRLKLLNLKDCRSLRSLPAKIRTESLETLIISGCPNLLELPEIDGEMERLKTLTFPVATKSKVCRRVCSKWNLWKSRT